MMVHEKVKRSREQVGAAKATRPQRGFNLPERKPEKQKDVVEHQISSVHLQELRTDDG